MTLTPPTSDDPDAERAKAAAQEAAAVEAQLTAAREDKKREEDRKRMVAAKRAFRSMWVAGTAGAFFTALTRNLPLHFQERSLSPDVLYTLDRFLRYGYLLWLLTYFFTSNLENEPDSIPEKWDIPFDVLQSACALVAAFGLGFIVPGSGFAVTSYGWAMGFANGAILVICIFSMIWFRDVPPTEVNPHRITGAIISCVGLVVALAGLPRLPALLLFATLQLALWATLYLYICKRLTLQPSEANKHTGG